MADDVLPQDDAEREMGLLNRHCVQLSEHFDSVQIIATRYSAEDGKTYKASCAFGNWYANFGAVEEWLADKREENKQNIRSVDDDAEPA